MILKGQNLRILIKEGSPVPMHCVAMATSCTVTLTGNTEDASHKDITGMAATPTIVSKSWSIQVDSLNVSDAAAMLLQIKNGQPFAVMFDETAGTNNQRPEQATFARTGQAYLSDITFNFNNRENSAKSIQLTGTGALERVATVESQVVNVNAYTKGQFVRLFLGSDNSAVPAKVIAAAMQLSLHVSLTLEDATTKDTTGDWVIQEPTALSYDISTTALVRTTETISSAVQAQALADVEEIYEAGTPVRWQIANTSSDNQRTKGTTIASGSCIITQLTINGANRQNADYTVQLTGYGELIVTA